MVAPGRYLHRIFDAVDGRRPEDAWSSINSLGALDGEFPGVVKRDPGLGRDVASPAKHPAIRDGTSKAEACRDVANSIEHVQGRRVSLPVLVALPQLTELVRAPARERTGS